MEAVNALRAKYLALSLLVLILLMGITYVAVADADECGDDVCGESEDSESCSADCGALTCAGAETSEDKCVVSNCPDEMDALQMDRDLCDYVVDNTNIYRFGRDDLLYADSLLMSLYLPYNSGETDQVETIPRKDIKCADPLALTLAWLDIESGDWVAIESNAYYVNEDGTPFMNYTAASDYVMVSLATSSANNFREALQASESHNRFYIAVIEARYPYSQQNRCIKTNCDPGEVYYTTERHPSSDAPGYTFSLEKDSKLVPGMPITFHVCPYGGDCKPKIGDGCDRRCPQGVDPDCGDMKCTTDEGDCCHLAQDGNCDKDCPESDPDCFCTEDLDGCCQGETYRGFLPDGTFMEREYWSEQGIDVGDPDCSSLAYNCTSDSYDCCKPDVDGICDGDCPRYPITAVIYGEVVNTERVADPDCCRKERVFDELTGTYVTGSFSGYQYAEKILDGCCLAKCDNYCDPDCLLGMDPDCEPAKNFRETFFGHDVGCVGCGNGICEYGAYGRITDVVNDLKELLNENDFETVTKVIVRISDEMAAAGMELNVELSELERMLQDPEALDEKIDELKAELTQMLIEKPTNCPEDCLDTCGNGICEPWEYEGGDLVGERQHLCPEDGDECAEFRSCLSYSAAGCEEQGLISNMGVTGMWSCPNGGCPG